MQQMPDRDYLRECFVYDQKTGILRWRMRPAAHFPTTDRRGSRWLASLWNSRNAAYIAGCINPTNGYRQVRIDGKGYLVHRIIWKIMTDESVFAIDHRNNVKDDNSWANLRTATAAQNIWNQRLHRDNRSGFKGVRIDTRHGGFIGRIHTGGRDIHLGKFKTAAEAHAAYCEAAMRRSSEFFNPG